MATHASITAKPGGDPQHAPSRRALLAGAAVAGPATAAALARPPVRPVQAVAPLAASIRPCPDAELIALCGEYVSAVDAYNADGGYLDSEDDPLWHAAERSRQRLDGLVATTMAGVLAKARVARLLAEQPDGHVDYSSSYTGDWPGQVIRNLLRLHGEAA